MPEFYGIIEPLILGTFESQRDQVAGVMLEKFLPLPDRIEKEAARIKRWLTLQRKAPQDRKVVFLFNNNPCAGTELSVGGASHLDSLESVAQIMQEMKERGYTVDNMPENGKELIETIMERKAISDFRWTPIEEIVQKGGVLATLKKEEYLQWWEQFPEQVKTKMAETWGEPVGEAMVYQEEIILTGVEYGNVLVVVQPKRGCYGPKCDGQVCKILHDPECPPTHQYLASYWYWQKVWGADLLVSVGTHGNLEFLPGKSLALSRECYPDLTLGEMPHLYLYSVDNPSEGTIAKRRAAAVLIDYLLPVMTNSGTYDELRELEQFLGEYGAARGNDPARAHSLEHLIVEAIEKSNLHKEMGITVENLQDHEYLAENFPTIVKKAHEALTRLRDSAIPDGMHIFGQAPQGEDLVELVLTEENLKGEEVARRILADKVRAWDLVANLEEFIPTIYLLRDKIAGCSREMDSLFLGMEGGYIPSGPSGCPTRGRPDVLPTGRNFYSMDPFTIPTKAAWRVGRVLATRMLENCGIILSCTDMMWTNGFY